MNRRERGEKRKRVKHEQKMKEKYV